VCVCVCVYVQKKKHTQTQAFSDLRHRRLHHDRYLRPCHDRFAPRLASAVRMPKRHCCVWSLCFCFHHYCQINYCIWVPVTVFTYYFFPIEMSMYTYKAFQTQDNGELQPSLVKETSWFWVGVYMELNVRPQYNFSFLCNVITLGGVCLEYLGQHGDKLWSWQDTHCDFSLSRVLSDIPGYFHYA